MEEKRETMRREGKKKKKKERNGGRHGKEIFTPMYKRCYTLDITCHNISDCAEAPRYGKFMKITALRSPACDIRKNFVGYFQRLAPCILYTRNHFAGRTRAISIKLNSN